MSPTSSEPAAAFSASSRSRRLPRERSYSEETARGSTIRCRSIVESAFDRTVGILRAQRDTLERGAQLLLEKETLGREDLRRLAAEAQALAAE